MVVEYNKDREYIISKITEIKKNNNNSSIWTNYYFSKFLENASITIVVTNSIVFILPDIDFYRLYFFSKSLSELSEILATIDLEPIVIDCISQEPIINLEKVFLKSGFKSYGQMIHMVKYNHTLLEKTKTMYFAVESDSNEIYKNLYLWLDKYTGHFPSKVELLKLIKNKQVIIEKKENRIIGFFIYKLQGITGNLDQWGFSQYEDDYNPHLALSLYTNTLNELYNKSVKKLFLWANINNKKIIKIHSLNGFKPDNLIDNIYLKKKKMRAQIIKILQELQPETDFTETTDFVENGLLDSFDIINLITTLDEHFGISIDGLDIIPENFNSIDSIVHLLMKNGVK